MREGEKMLVDPIRAVEETNRVRHINEETHKGKKQSERPRSSVGLWWMCGHASVASLNNLSHPVNNPARIVRDRGAVATRPMHYTGLLRLQIPSRGLVFAPRQIYLKSC